MTDAEWLSQNLWQLHAPSWEARIRNVLAENEKQLEYVRRLEEVARAALALRPIGSPVSINQMNRLERALKALSDDFIVPEDGSVGPDTAV